MYVRVVLQISNLAYILTSPESPSYIYVLAIWHKIMCKISEMVIPRTTIKYCKLIPNS